MFSLTVLAFYGALGVVAFWPLLGDSHRVPAQIYGDPVQMVWFFGWTAHAVTTGHNPFFSHMANAPYGINMAQLTFAPLLGVLFLPVTLIAGPVPSVTWAFVMAMPVSAASAYGVLRRWRIWAPAAAVGGLAYGFSPYMVNQAGTHLNLAFAPLPPLIVATVVRLLTRPRNPIRWGAALGGLAAAQFLVSSEILAITAVVGIAGLTLAGAFCAERRREELRAAIGPALKGTAAAIAVAVPLLAYPIWFEFAGPRHYIGAPWGYQSGYNASLLEFVAPTPHQLVHPALGATGASLYAASYLEDGAYLGFGTLVVVAALVWLRRASVRMKLTAALGAVSAVLSFGDFIYISGTRHRVTLPFHLLSELPALGDIVPVRFSFATATCVAALLAFGLDGLHRSAADHAEGSARAARTTGWHASLALVAVCSLVGVTWLPAWPFPTQSVTTLPSAVTRSLPPGDPVVLTYPYPVIGEDVAMLWQAAAGFPFHLIGVYARVPQANGAPGSQSPLLDPPEVQEFLTTAEVDAAPVALPLDLIAQTRDFVRQQHVGAVIVSLSGPHAATVAKLFCAALGPPRLTSRGFQLWLPDH